MPEAPLILPEETAIRRIVETVAHANPGEAPFALVLGSGFSHGLVPTARELVTGSLPLWIKALNEGRSFDSQLQTPLEQYADIAGAYWRKFVENNSPLGLKLELNAQGIPLDYAAAYQAAFDSRYSGAVGLPAPARKFQRALMRLDRPRLNAAHFLLASIFGAQPGRSGNSPLFKFRSAFSRLILTTNFDPFLQIALQAVNRLYFMSDTPNLGVGDELFDEHTDAVHLVYLHGSIHRRSQAASQPDITELKLKNARSLAPVLKRRGVIVLGYSGWDDALVEALDACDRFDHGLYWCGLRSDPLAKDAFGNRVPDILRKPSASYVPTSGAGAFMAKLLNELVVGLPRLLANPIGQLVEMLAAIDLKEIETLETPSLRSVSAAINKLDDAGFCRGTFSQAHKTTLENLRHAERIFVGEIDSVRAKNSLKDEAAKPKRRLSASGNADERKPNDEESQINRLIASVSLAEGLSNYAEVLKLCDEGLRSSKVEIADQSRLLVCRGVARYHLKNLEQAIVDWGRVIELQHVPVRDMAVALYNRAFAWGKKGESDKEITDYTRLIEATPGAPIDYVARALNNRGFSWSQRNETDKAIADYTRLIEATPGAPADPMVRALNNRAIAWGKKDETDKAIADYTRLIEATPGAPIEQVATALNNRAIAWSKKDETDKAIADYTRLIEATPGPPIEQVATALNNRGIAWSKKNETDKAIADYTRLIEATPGAPIEQVARAQGSRGWSAYRSGKFAAFLADTETALKSHLTDFITFNYGLALMANGRDEDALQAYYRAARQFPSEIDKMGLVDLREATGKWLSPERAQPVLRLLESLKK